MATKIMKISRPDECVACGEDLEVGIRAEWDNVARHVTCLACVEARGATGGDGDASLHADDSSQPEPHVATSAGDLDVGVAGASARQEHERRVAKREKRIEDRYGTGFLGRTVKVFSEEPQSIRAWKQGAAGEEKLASILGPRLGEAAVVLHDRKVPGTRGNIDHIAVGPSGVWVIDAKNYKGLVERRDKGGMFKSDFRLYVGGRDRSKLVEGMGWQSDAVRTALTDADVPVMLALTFINAEFPIFFNRPRRFGDVLVVRPRKLSQLILADGPLDPDDVQRIARQLAEALSTK